nr:MAG TPA: hypothetical protein [Bacteriophage sp.]
MCIFKTIFTIVIGICFPMKFWVSIFLTLL